MSAAPDSGRGKLGRLLQQHRRSAQLTQEELASRAGLSTRTIRYLESGRTRRPQRESVRLLAQALDLGEAAHEELLTVALEAGEAPPIAGLPPDAVAAVPSTGVVGRAELLDALITTLGSKPCVVSLTGLPGVGKTCVAVAAVQSLSAQWDLGVLWVSCRATLRHGESAAFRVPEHLTDHLAREPWIVVLDAAEHWNAVADDIAALRAAYPLVRVLVTSVRPVPVDGGYQWTVDPLGLPGVDTRDVNDLLDVPAVAMFVARLRQRRPHYVLTENDAGSVAALVRRLDGLPLALELAAGHGRILTPADMLERYGDHVLDLSGSSSLGEVLNRSLKLLDEDERQLLERMAIFVRSWTVTLAAAMFDGSDVTLVLDRLCDMGLVQTVVDGSTMRFHVLDSVRQVTRDQWGGRWPAGVRLRYSEVMFTSARQWAPGINGPDQMSVLHELDQAAADIERTLTDGEADGRLALEAATALGPYWCIRSRAHIGRAIVERLLPNCRTTLELANAQLQLGRLLIYESRQADAEPYLRRAWELFGNLDDESHQVDALILLTRALREQSDFGAGNRAAVAAYRLAARLGDARKLAVTRNNLVFDDLRCGRTQAARRRLRRSAAVFDPASRYRAITGVNVAHAWRLEGHIEEARQGYLQAIGQLGPFHDTGLLIQVYCRLAMCETVLGRGVAADEALAEAERISDQSPGAENLQWTSLAGGAIAASRGDRRSARTLLRAAMTRFEQRGRHREAVEAGVLLVPVASIAERHVLFDRLRHLQRNGGFRLTGIEEDILIQARAA